MSALEGADRALQQLLALDRAIEGSLEGAAEVGAQVVVDEIRRRAPRRRGELAESVDHRARDTGRGYASRLVFVGAFYGFFLEYGTGPKTPQERQAMTIGEDFTKRSGRTPKRPFFRPGTDASRNDARNAMHRYIRWRTELIL